MDPANRVLLQVTLDDAATADELFSILMGEDVESRRSFITRNAKDVRFLDVKLSRRLRQRERNSQ
jgi:DNA gyrase subunit B